MEEFCQQTTEYPPFFNKNGKNAFSDSDERKAVKEFPSEITFVTTGGVNFVSHSLRMKVPPRVVGLIFSSFFSQNFLFVPKIN